MADNKDSSSEEQRKQPIVQQANQSGQSSGQGKNQDPQRDGTSGIKRHEDKMDDDEGGT
jgi:hypothetical protein